MPAIKFHKTPLLGAVTTPAYFVTRQVLISYPIKNWLTIMGQQDLERRERVWKEIESVANAERAVSNDLEITRKEFSDRKIALIAGTKLTGNSMNTGRVMGEFKFILVDDEFLLDTLRQEFGVKIPKNKTWEELRHGEAIERR